jgi:hypothetical protein
MTDAQRWGITAGAAVVAFLIGFGWQYTRAAGFSGELDDTRRELTFHRLEATLGAATIDAQRGSFEVARQLASEFFTGLQENVAQAPQPAQAELRSILGQRDAIITSLSRGDPASGDLLSRLFVRFRVALRGPDRALPVSTPRAPEPAPAAADSPGR